MDSRIDHESITDAWLHQPVDSRVPPNTRAAPGHEAARRCQGGGFRHTSPRECGSFATPVQPRGVVLRSEDYRESAIVPGPTLGKTIRSVSLLIAGAPSESRAGGDPEKLQWQGAAVKLAITIYQDEDSMFVAECPAVPGCVSQGRSETEAEANIKDAIRECLAVRAAKGLPLTAVTREVEVSV